MPQQIQEVPGAEGSDAPACLFGEVSQVPGNQHSAAGGGDFQEGQIPRIGQRGCQRHRRHRFGDGADPFEHDGRILGVNPEFAAVQHRFVLVENPVVGAQIERAVGQQALLTGKTMAENMDLSPYRLKGTVPREWLRLLATPGEVRYTIVAVGTGPANGKTVPSGPANDQKGK